MANRKKPGTPGKDYEVGYGRPPKAGQFKKGQSGNRSGKRPGTRHLGTLFDKELDQTISVTEGGKIIRISKRELVVKAVVNTAVKGDLRAIELLARLSGGGAQDEGHDLDGFTPAMIANYLKRHGGAKIVSEDGEDDDD
jgi:hypothetical protein